MGKLSNFVGSMEVPSGLRFINNQDNPILEAHSILANDEKENNRLDDVLSQINLDIAGLKDKLEGTGTSGGSSNVAEGTTPSSYFTFDTADDDPDAYSISCADETLERIVIPRTYNGKLIKQVGSFEKCSKLRHISIPNTVVKISARAFYRCPELIAIFVPESVKYIGSHAFRFCPKLEIVSIPNSVTYIDQTIAEGRELLAGGTINYSTVMYCAATSKPDGWNDFWAGIGAGLVPTVWGADLANVKPDVMSAGSAYRSYTADKADTADNAAKADKAEKASCDINGNRIDTTYATATNFNSLLTGDTKAKRAEWIGEPAIIGTVNGNTQRDVYFKLTGTPGGIYILEVQLSNPDDIDGENPLAHSAVAGAIFPLNTALPSYCVLYYKDKPVHVKIRCISSETNIFASLEIIDDDSDKDVPSIKIGYADIRKITG